MQTFSNIVSNLSWCVVAFVLMGLALAQPGFRERGWVVGFTVTAFMGVLANTVVWVVLPAMEVFEPENRYRLGAVLNPLISLLFAISHGALLAFFIAQRPGPGAASILFSFAGRIARQHFWLGAAVLAPIGWTMGAMLVAAVYGDDLVHVDTGQAIGAWTAYGLWAIPAVWMGLAMQVKRWHDRGKSGWMVLVNLIPVAGPIWAFVELGCLPGDPAANAYGANPLAAREAPGMPAAFPIA